MTKLVFFGNEQLATGFSSSTLPLAHGLLETGHEIAAIVINASPTRSRKKQASAIVDFAAKHNIPCLAPLGPQAIKNELVAIGADVAVLAAYGRIIKQDIIDIFPHGIINLHPSLLPLYRGSTPIESTILHGDTTTGVSVMQLTAGMDEGPVFAQQTVPLDQTETKVALAERLAAIGATLLVESLSAIVDGQLQPTPQSDTLATYTQQISKADGQIDWSKPAVQIEREIRAYLGWPGSHTTLGSVELVITKAKVQPGSAGRPGAINVNAALGELTISTGDNSLSIETLKPVGKKEMPVKAFLAGYRSRLAV